MEAWLRRKRPGGGETARLATGRLARLSARMVVMTTVPVGDAKNHLSEYVAEVARTHERITITRHGRPTALLISVDDLDSLEETLDILSTPGEYGAIQEGLKEADRGEYVDIDALKARYGLRPRG